MTEFLIEILVAAESREVESGTMSVSVLKVEVMYVEDGEVEGGVSSTSGVSDPKVDPRIVYCSSPYAYVVSNQHSLKRSLL